MNQIHEILRDAIKNFKLANDRLDSQITECDERAISEELRIESQAESAKQYADACLFSVENLQSSNTRRPEDIPTDLAVSFRPLEQHAKSSQSLNRELQQMRERACRLQIELDEALRQEEAERKRREKLRQEALQKEMDARNRRRAVRAVLAIISAFVLIFAHFHYEKQTSLALTISSDFEQLRDDTGITLDGNPFKSGNGVTVGLHHLKVEAENFDTFEKRIWIFYGTNDLGPVKLQRSIGWLTTTATPNPTKVIVRDKTKTYYSEAIAPSKLELPVGDYFVDYFRGEHVEQLIIPIKSRELSERNFMFSLGTLKLTSVPPDADFELSNGKKVWRGKLPSILEDLPTGDCTFSATRNGWRQEKTISVVQNQITSSEITFSYASLDVNSAPTGMSVQLNGRSLGKTPFKANELIPSKYEVIVTDGENRFSEQITLSPDENAKKVFEFRYSDVQLSTIPPGATVSRNGKGIGTSPLIIRRLVGGESDLAVQLKKYAPTNVILTGPETHTNINLKLWQTDYLSAMTQAANDLKEQKFEEARNSVSTALVLEPGDHNALNLLGEITRSAETWKRDQEELRKTTERKEQEDRRKAAEQERQRKLALQQQLENQAKWEKEEAERQTKQKIQKFSSLPVLDPESVVNDCLMGSAPGQIPPKKPGIFSDTATEGAAKDNPVAVPVAVATDAVVLSIKALTFPFKKRPEKQKEKTPRLNQTHFQATYSGKPFRYLGVVEKVDPDKNLVVFTSRGKGEKSCKVIAHIGWPFPSIRSGSVIWAFGDFSELDEAEKSVGAANVLILTNCSTYPENILNEKK
jgi:hypothetical protein